jgi:AcrR family transcriptional regulator
VRYDAAQTVIRADDYLFETPNAQSERNMNRLSQERGAGEALQESSLSRTPDATSEPQALSRKERRHRDTRQEILQAARELLLEVDPDELSLRQVAHRASFSPAALYTYFSSRDELIKALLTDSLTRLSDHLATVSVELPPDRRVVELGTAYMDFARANPTDLRCILLAARRGISADADRSAGLETLVKRTFQEGVSSGVFAETPDLTPSEMAYGMWALVHGMASLGVLNLSELTDVISPAPRRVLEAFVARLRVTADQARPR